MMWCDVSSVRIKKVPATQRHHRERARYFISSVSLWTAYVFTIT